ncbi:hypothetical protein OWV82_003805 [Melia azedarach]|uniref:Uncharacterized protein n=1 Tax=Melia azedarach TaxID=155640 RepID=A0ACC1YM47_MELAZ|nr:hypothetical protein OWV82_003805 [Melia azedarach]
MLIFAWALQASFVILRSYAQVDDKAMKFALGVCFMPITGWFSKVAILNFRWVIAVRVATGLAPKSKL